MTITNMPTDSKVEALVQWLTKRGSKQNTREKIDQN